MFTTLTIFVAWFAFGYSVADIIMTAYRSVETDKAFKEMVKRETE